MSEIPNLANLPTQPVERAECVMFVAREGDEDGKVEWTFNVALLEDVEPKHVRWAQKRLCVPDEWEERDVQTAAFLFPIFQFEEEHEDDVALAQAAAAERKIFFSSTTSFPDHLFAPRRGGRRPIVVVKTYTTSYETEG